jgi:hypothetical protein
MRAEYRLMTALSTSARCNWRCLRAFGMPRCVSLFVDNLSGRRVHNVATVNGISREKPCFGIDEKKLATVADLYDTLLLIVRLPRCQFLSVA